MASSDGIKVVMYWRILVPSLKISPVEIPDFKSSSKHICPYSLGLCTAGRYLGSFCGYAMPIAPAVIRAICAKSSPAFVHDITNSKEMAREGESVVSPHLLIFTFIMSPCDNDGDGSDGDKLIAIMQDLYTQGLHMRRN